MSLQSRSLPINLGSIDHYYLCNYRPHQAGSDELSRSLLCFKRGWVLHVKAWKECSVSALKEVGVQESTVIIRALGSDEISVDLTSRTPLDELGLSIAGAFGCKYFPQCLTKKRKIEKLKSLSLPERESALDGVYDFNNGLLLDEPDEILIIDDILTSGTTVRAIAESIENALPDVPMRVFTLAATDRMSLLNQSLRLNSNLYSWEPRKGWTTVSGEDSEFYFDLASLKRKILFDTFE